VRLPRYLPSTQAYTNVTPYCTSYFVTNPNANAYSKLDLKNVLAWLDLRNRAAHGHYDGYTEGQVALLIQALRDFITRHPA